MTTLKLHPEQKDDEFFVTNIPKISEVEFDCQTENDFDYIGWQTKRLGLKAYDRYGNINEDLLPVFCQKSEVKQKASEDYERIEQKQKALYP